jgi:hypothetical protein
VPLGERRYAVQSSDGAQWVDMHGDEPCYCEDALLDDEPWVCKHLLRALLEEGHPVVTAELARLRGEEERANRRASNPFVED